MKICILVEGSYPYVTGGVSSWLQTMIKEAPEHEFIIYAIGAESKKKGQYKYDIPENVVEIVEVFLDDMRLNNKNNGKIYLMRDKYKKALKGLLSGKDINWKDIFEFFREKSFKDVSEFFMSKNFYSLVRELYEEKYPYTPYAEFLWTIRSMYITLFYLLMNPPPKADLYHSLSTGYSGVIGSYGKYLYDAPFILSEHGIYTREREEEVIKAEWIKGYHKDIWIKFFVSLSRCSYEFSDRVTSLFEVNKELQIELGCPEEKIEIIPNGIDISRFENIPTKDKDDNYINVGIIARVVPIKDIKTLIMSFDIVKSQLENVRLYIMGPTEDEEEYFNECKDLVERFGINDVIFTGTINVNDYIGKMDILMITSLSEGQPLAVMEGMAAKKPHVCTNVGDCAGLLFGYNDGYGHNGFIEYVMDYNGIANSIIKLCKDKDLRENMGIAGYERVKNLYTKDGFVKQYKDIYERYGGAKRWQE